VIRLRALRAHKDTLGPRLPLLLLLIALVAQGAVAVWLGRDGWFSGDVMRYYIERGGLPGGSEGLNDPHESHWQLTLIVIYLVMFKFVGLTTYLPYLLLTIAVHLLLVTVLFFLLQRLGIRRWTALVACVILLTYGAGSEAFLVEAPVALTATMLLGATALLLLVRQDFSTRSTWVGSLVLLVGVMTSIGGVVAAIWVGVAALSRGFGATARVVALPAVAFSTWYLVLGRSDGRVLLEGDDWLRIPETTWVLLTTPFDDLWGGSGIGPAVLLGVVVATLSRMKANPVLASVALAGLVAAMAQAVLSSVAQIPYGLDQVTTSRYRYVVLATMLPSLALALDALVDLVRDSVPDRQRRLALVPAMVVVVGMLVHAALGQHRTAQGLESVGGETLSLLEGTFAAASAGEKQINDAVRGSYISGDDLARLVEPDTEGELPALEPSARDRLRAEGQYFVRVSGEDFVEVAAPARLQSSSFDRSVSLRPGCQTYEANTGLPVITVRTYTEAGLTITSDASSVTTRLSRPEEDLVGEHVQWRVEPGEPTQIATTAQIAELEIAFDAGGEFTVCVPRPPAG
jgi:hypothetical protein